ERLLVRLVFDSVALTAALIRHAGSRDLRVLDVGSGSGFPAAAIAVARPRWAVTAIDSVSKKAAFVRQAAAQCGVANLRVIAGRVEALVPTWEFDVIVSKALGSLAEFAVATAGALAAGGVWVAQKGKHPSGEM